MPGEGRLSGRTGVALGGVFAGFIFAGFGTLWTILVFVTTADAPLVIHLIFPMFGLLFVVIGIGLAAGSWVSAARTGQVGLIESPTASPAFGEAGKTRSLVQCECGEPFRVGAQFCTRCGKPTHEFTP